MNADLLEDILQCPTLPSLPAVAVKVIELTSDPDVRMEDLATTIQMDQALAAKVLRTVNSSFFGLVQKCSTINKAIVMLGLGPVKSLALGFSLVSAIDMDDDGGFPFVDYWRRGLFGAVGARAVAEAAELRCGDEAFLAGLLQDIGMIAFHEALGRDYLKVLDQAGGSHSGLVKAELSTLEIQHPDVGAMLAERWRLPPVLTLPIKYHERPTAVPDEAREITRLIAVGRLAHDALTLDEPVEPRRKFHQRCSEWFGINAAAADECFKRISSGTKEMADLFRLDVGSFKDPEAVVAAADKKLVELSKTEPRESFAAGQLESLVAGDGTTDPLTGVLSKRGFITAAAEAFDRCRGASDPIVVVQAAVEGINELKQRYDEIAVDEVVISAVAMMYKHFEPLGGVIGRLGEALFGVVVANATHADTAKVAERFRGDLATMAHHWLPEGAGGTIAVRVTIGLAAADASSFAAFANHERLIAAGFKAVKDARTAGGDCLRTFTAPGAGDAKAAA